MIASLEGTVTHLHKNFLILSVKGVGYEVCASSKTLSELALAEKTSLWIYTHVREDTLKLYGFSRFMEKKIFLSFIGINGVGPKMALVVLSAASSLKALLEMVDTGDMKGLTGLPRVGKKMAGQIILALKGQLKEEWLERDEKQTKLRESLTSALLHLGFRASEIKMVLNGMKLGQSMEEELKKALSCLQPGR